MSAEPRCSFCVRLPPLPDRRVRAGNPARCPLCKGELVVDRSAGVTYRRDQSCAADGGHPAPHRRSRGAYALAGGMALVVMSGLLVKFVSSPNPKSSPPASAVAPVAQTEESKLAQAPPVREEAPPPLDRVARPEQPRAAEPENVVVAAPPKPAPQPRVQASRPTVTAPAVVSAPTKAAPALEASVTPSVWERSYSDEELAEMLRKVPEVSLLSGPVVSTSSGEAKAGKDGPSPWNDLEKAVKDHRERFRDKFLAKRADLAGLPFRKAEECQLDAERTVELFESSRSIRTLLGDVFGTRGRSAAGGEPAELTDYEVHARSSQLAGNPKLGGPPSIPALQQILSGEAAPLRWRLAQHLRNLPDAAAVAPALARLALFDPSAEVRREAIRGLELRPDGEYLSLLLSGLHYPWPPANFHAAEALVTLRPDSAVPELVKLLDAPDPRAPFELEKEGKKVPAVRELVRLNHNSNCLLCHAPSSGNDVIRAPVPSPSNPLPPRFSPAYYYGGRGASGSNLFVRAEITYLRQDFSEVQPVENPGKWPKRQRFDFLVRVRPLAEDEAAAWQMRGQLAGPPELPASQRATLFALQELTGLDGGFTAASWEQALEAKRKRKSN